ncbi:oocyte zinc finger protein XlCOF6 isoform X1 [Folsomia candida]|uniref:oocyte zinc finger protein XlCOF6 isoform X1 n=2 Tax=Folsomia candida TaxID=158441 RepID=UPI001604B1FE|nr:oocyte zinc finger protein XlCOF6 isoform X1 [Folsomia candida]
MAMCHVPRNVRMGLRMDTRRGNELTCSTCSKPFSNKNDLKRHMFTHDPDAKVKCEICGKMLKNPATLSIHVRTLHTKLDRPTCDTCHKIVSTSASLRIHIDTVHSKIKRPRFPCEFPNCEKSYLRKGDLSVHKTTEHTENPTRFPCTLCGKEFKIRKNLEMHISSHTTEKAYTCSTCGRSYAQQTAMKHHEATHLEKSSQKIFRCELCAQTFLARASLRQHIHAVHENRRNHPCSFCGKRFSTSTNIRYHVEAFHSANKEKVHSCDKCEYRSHSKENLAQHVRRHNHANRREFYFCRKQFVNFSKLVTHCRHHTLEF